MTKAELLTKFVEFLNEHDWDIANIYFSPMGERDDAGDTTYLEKDELRSLIREFLDTITP